MQAHCAEVFRDHCLVRLLGFRLSANRPLPLFSSSAARVSCSFLDSRLSQGWKQRAGRYEMVRAKKKDNVWSIDNEFASKKAAEEKRGLTQRRKMRKKVKGSSRSSGDSTVMVTRAMLTEIETVLQTQEPVIKPFWDIFASSLTGIWKGLGAVFSPITAEMEPIDVGNQNENLYDCYNLSSIEKIPSEGPASQILRKTNWGALNPFGESRKHASASNRAAGSVKSSISGELTSDAGDMEFDLPDYESFDFSLSESEEDLMSLEPGLVFFEDGSYSRGPVNIPIGEYDESKYFLSPTYMFEQCLVKGCHKRLRIVHTIEFNEGGANIQITRVAVYEEEWVSPVNVSIGDGMPFDAKPISQRRRIQPSELVGSWKVFEVSATPVFSSVEEATLEGNPAFVYLCMETLKKRSLPESSAYFGEEAELDMNDVTVLWLPGGVAAYVDVNEEGILCIGISWYSDEGLNLVMERDYGMDGNLKEVRWKSEIKRRWP